MKNSNLSRNKLTLLALTWPIFVEILLRMLLGNIDTIMLSHYSDNAVAAVGVVNQITNMVVIIYTIVSLGAAIIISQYTGAGNKESALKTASAALAVNLLFGMLLSVCLMVFGRQILRLMNLQEDLMGYGIQYLSIVGGFSFTQALLATITAIIRSHGNTKAPMFVAAGMNILNVLGNAVFIFGLFGLPALGVKGVAVSTVFSQLTGFLFMFFVVLKKVGIRLPLSSLLSFPRNIIINILKIGVPSAGEAVAYNSSQLAITYIISLMGTAALTTKVYTWNIMWFIMLFSIAIGQGTQILVGHKVGAGRNSEAYGMCLRSLKFGITISLAMSLIVSVFREHLLGIFTENTSIIETGSILLLLTFFLESGRSFNVVINNSLRAAGDVKFPVIMGIISMWGVSVVLSYILGIKLNLGLVGVWIALAADEWLRGLIMLWRWRSKVWEKYSLTSNLESDKEISCS